MPLCMHHSTETEQWGINVILLLQETFIFGISTLPCNAKPKHFIRLKKDTEDESELQFITEDIHKLITYHA